MGGDIQFILDDKLGNIDLHTGKDPIKTPFVCPEFWRTEFDADTKDDDSLDTKHWIQIKITSRVMEVDHWIIEVHVGHPPDGMPYSTLWRGHNWLMSVLDL